MTYELKVEGDKEEWQKTSVANLIGGLNLLDREDQLDTSEAITCKNLVLKKGKAYRDTGYVAFGDSVVGTPQADYQFFKKSGTSELMLVTTLTLYRYATAVSQWQYVTGTASTTLTAQANAGATALTVASIAGFGNGDRIGVTLDDGSQHKTTVNGAPAGNTINITDAIPAGRFAPNGAAVVRAVVLAGSLDKAVIMETIPSHDWFVFTNGIDIVKRYDGTNCVDIPNLPSSGNVVCMALRLYNKALFLLNTTEGGTAHPQRVRRSDIGDPENWTTGTAGFDDLYDSSDVIFAGEVLGPYLVVYRERSIERGQFIGSGGINYHFESMIKGEGVASSQSIIDMGDYHIFVGNANIYEYRGGFDIEPIGDKIYSIMFGPESDINPTNRRRIFAFFVEELNEAWIFSPTTNSENCNRLLRYNISEESFSERRFNHAFVGYGFYTVQDTKDWASLIGDWAAQTWLWGVSVLQADAPTTHLCSENTEVYEYDYFEQTDNGAAIDYIIETKDFVLPDAVFRFDSIEGYLRGLNVLIEYSTNGGEDWSTIGTVSNTLNRRFAKFKQIVTDKIRFRFSGSDPTFMLSYFEFFWRWEAPR